MTNATFQFRRCMEECRSGLDAFLLHFTSPSAPVHVGPLSTRFSSDAFSAFFVSPAWTPTHTHTLTATAAVGVEYKATLETAFKRKIDEAIRTNATEFDHPSNVVTLLLDGALYCKSHGHLDHLSHLSLIEDLLESQTIETAEKLFTQIIDTRIDAFIKASDSQRARLLFFRLCNNLLRRLSKTTNTFFAGQISMKISYICPVDERSAVNISGRFNKENVTLALDPPAVEREEGEAEEEESKGESVYELLWALQGFFGDPTALKTPSVLAAFHRSAEVSLTQFERLAVSEKDAVAAIVSSNGVGIGAAATPSVFPKYLTGGRLLELQLKDAVFRREVALQLLLFLAHVLNPLGNVEVMKEIMTPAPQQATQAAATTNPATTPSTGGASTTASATTAAQLAQTNLSGVFLPVAAIPPLRSLFLRTLKLYKLTPPFSFQFSESFLALLSREQKFWVGWKEAKCPPIERPKMDIAELKKTVMMEEVAKEERRKRAGESAIAPAPHAGDLSKKRKVGTMSGFGGGFRPKPTPMFMESEGLLKVHDRWLMGSENLARLWDPSLDSNSASDEFMKSEDRKFMPDLQNMIQTLVDEEEEYIQAEEKRKIRREERKVKQEQAAAVKVKVEGDGDATMNADSLDADAQVDGDEDDDGDDGDIQLKDMLKSDARKQWQFLRLCLLTPTVDAVWYRTDSFDDRAVPQVSGIDLFMRSEGSLTKLVAAWIEDRKRGISDTNKAADEPAEEELQPAPAALTPTDALGTEAVVSVSSIGVDTPQPIEVDTPQPSMESTPAPSPITTEPDAADSNPPNAASAPADDTSDETPMQHEEEPPAKRVKIEADAADKGEPTAPSMTPLPTAETASMDTL